MGNGMRVGVVVVGVVGLVAGLVYGFRGPVVTEVFRGQVVGFMEAGSEVDAGTSHGVRYDQMNEKVSRAQGLYEVLKGTWVEGVPRDGQAEMEHALKGWGLALRMWSLKMENKDTPTEPDVNGYREFIEYGGDGLMVETRPMDSLVVKYRGKKCLPMKYNISLLLGIASKSFNAGKAKMIKTLSEN